MNFKGRGRTADITMTAIMSLKRLEVMRRAKRDPQARLRGLARSLDYEALMRAFDALRRNEVVGVDGIAKDKCAQDLESNIRGLQERLKAGRYRHQPI